MNDWITYWLPTLTAIKPALSDGKESLQTYLTSTFSYLSCTPYRVESSMCFVLHSVHHATKSFSLIAGPYLDNTYVVNYSYVNLHLPWIARVPVLVLFSVLMAALGGRIMPIMRHIRDCPWMVRMMNALMPLRVGTLS